MDDPNVTYKRAFAALQKKLGRVPGVQDAEWLVIGNEYSRGWAPAEETVTKPTGGSDVDHEAIHRPVRPGVLSLGNVSAREGAGTSDGQAPRAGSVAARGGSHLHRPWRQPLSGPAEDLMAALQQSLGIEQPLSGPGTNPTGGEAESVHVTGGGPGWNSQRATSGRRGPSGGILAQCVVCGQEWERGRVRGRPSVKCERCR